jgi:opacity protein-like surface antigen
MRKIAIGLALCSTALASPALARDNAVYVEAGFGPSLAQDFEIEPVEPARLDAELEEDHGFDGGVAIGYDYGSFRIEIEGSYREFDHDRFSFASGPVYEGPLGKSTTASVMGNALLDLGDDDGLQFFVGAGAGSVYVDQAVAVTPDGLEQNLFNGDEWEFAWQALAGVRAPLTENLDVGLRYRFFNVPDYRIGGSFGTPYIDTDWSSHSILGTVTLNFGEREEVLPPPPPPPPPPAPLPPAPPPPPPPAPVC